MNGQQDGAQGVSAAERELFGGRLRWKQAYVEHEGALARMRFGKMAAALPRMVGVVLRARWRADPRALAGLIIAQVGQGLTAGFGLVAVNRVLTQLFANGPTADKLEQSLPALLVLAVVSVGAALLSAWSTAMSGRLEPQVERAVSTRYYRAVTVYGAGMGVTFVLRWPYCTAATMSPRGPRTISSPSCRGEQSP